MKSNKNIYFIHANGYPPNAYSSMFSKLQKSCNINYFNLVSDSINIKKLKNWQPFHASFIKTIKTNENKTWNNNNHLIICGFTESIYADFCHSCFSDRVFDFVA